MNGVVRLSETFELPAVAGDRLTDRISIGVLARVVPRDVVDEVLAETRRTEQRTRLLPARVVVYFTMAMCLFFEDDYEEVMRRLVEDGMEGSDDGGDLPGPGTAGAGAGEAAVRAGRQRDADPDAPPTEPARYPPEQSCRSPAPSQAPAHTRLSRAPETPANPLPAQPPKRSASCGD